ncbi:MAG: cyclase family protein [Vicinamibacterales bacterium]
MVCLSRLSVSVGLAAVCVSGLTVRAGQQPAATTELSPAVRALEQAPDVKPTYPKGPYSVEELRQLVASISNWGRWGADDELGALNLITPEKRRQAAKAVRHGIALSLAKRDRGIIQHQFARPKGPPQLFAGGYQLPGHNDGQTHIDALCHVWFDGKAYNGFTPEQVIGEKGCMHLGLSGYMHGGIVTRAVLIDMPRLKGVPYLEPMTPVMTEDLLAWEKKVGVRIGPGDAILVRMGRWVRDEKFPEHPVTMTQLTKVGQAGLHPSLGPFLKERGVAFIGQDGGAGVFPSSVPGYIAPFSIVATNALGIPLVVAMDLDEAVETAARLKQWELQLVVGPLQLPAGTGSAVHPVGVF